MKIITFTLILYLCYISISLTGQNTINRNNYFKLGNSYNYVYLEDIVKDSVIIAGSDVIWDFSNCTQTAQFDTMHAIDPSTTPFFNNYNISNLCLYEPLGMEYDYDDNLYNYYLSDDSSIQFIGNWADNGTWETWYYHLTDPEKYFNFPLSFNDSFQDSFAGSLYDMSGSGLHTLHGTRDIIADGYGTLILPTVIYTDCLRIKSTRITIDSSSTWGIIIWTEIKYTWFQLMHNGPILEIQGDTNFYNVNSKFYYDNPLVGINESKEDFDITVFPNPFNDYISVKIFKPGLKNLIIRLNNSQGKVMFRRTEVYSFDLYNDLFNLGDLPQGVYFLEIITDRDRAVKKLIKQ